MSHSSKSDVTRKQSLQEIKARKRKEMQETIDLIDNIFDPYAEAASCLKNLRLKTGIVYDLETLNHKCEWDINYPENPYRLKSILDRIEELNLIPRCHLIPSIRTDTIDRVLSKHSQNLVETLEEISKKEDVTELENAAKKYDSVYFNKHTYDNACRAVAAVLNLVENVANGSIHNGFALVRPPGHHAMSNEFCGYCFFNNVAIAAEMCLEEKLAEKILIVDFDVHHGQATQQMFYDTKNVLYFSIHRFEHGTFWPNLEESNFNFIGNGQGKGYNINVPLNETGLEDQDYMAIVFNLLLPVAYEYNPDLIIVSGGYDSCLGDEKGRMMVTPGFYSHLITLLSGLANGKIAVCLEGGYFPPSLAEGAALTLKALLGDPCPKLKPLRNIHPTVVDTINNVRRILHPYWNCFKICRIVDSEIAEHKSYIKYFGTPLQYPYETSDCYPSLSQNEKNQNTLMIKALQENYNTKILPVCYAYDDKMMLHAPEANEAERPERPERIKIVYDTLASNNILQRLIKLEVGDIDFSKHNLHDKLYLSKLKNLELEKSNDIYFNEHTYSAILKAISSILRVVDEVIQQKASSGVGIIRPPGHHAEIKQAMGFCFINNVAVAANYLKQKYGLERILILDFDVHHGNGTQDIFYNDKSVMYISVHRFDNGKFFPTKKSADYTYTGYGFGEGYNINIPFNKDKMSDTEYIAVFHNIILPIAYSYAPEFVLISAGFDAGINDPLGGYNLSPEIFGHFIQLLKPLAEGKLVLCMEGGYNLTTLGYGMSVCVKSLLGDPIPRLKNLYKNFSDNCCQTITDVQRFLKKYWPVFNVNETLGEQIYECLTPKENFDYDDNLYKVYTNC